MSRRRSVWGVRRVKQAALCTPRSAVCTHLAATQGPAIDQALLRQAAAVHQPATSNAEAAEEQACSQWQIWAQLVKVAAGNLPPSTAQQTSGRHLDGGPAAVVAPWQAAHEAQEAGCHSLPNQTVIMPDATGAAGLLPCMLLLFCDAQ
jgi:hypothetical protein